MGKSIETRKRKTFEGEEIQCEQDSHNYPQKDEHKDEIEEPHLFDSNFEFDAPRLMCDLIESTTSYDRHTSIDTWFRVPHEHHILSSSDTASKDSKNGLVDKHNLTGNHTVSSRPLREPKIVKMSKDENAEAAARTTCTIQRCVPPKKFNGSSYCQNNTKKYTNSSNNLNDDLDDLQALINKHNQKFQSKMHTYEPRHNSVSQVRKWEKMYKKKYSSLSVLERKIANQQIQQHEA